MIRRLGWALAALVLLRADMYPDASNAKLPQARQNIGAGNPVSIKDYGAKADSITRQDAAIAAGGNVLTSTQAVFTQADVGKKIQVDGAGGIFQPPLATTISAVTSANTVTLAAPASVATPRRWLSQAGVITPRSTGNYQPGDVMALMGGTFATAATVKVVSTKVTATSVVAGGSGGVNGSCGVQGTTGNGTRFQQTVTVSGGAITAVGLLGENHYFANPTNLAAEPVQNAPGWACVPTGAILSLTMGVDQVVVENRGDYDPIAIPADPIASTAGSLSGATGATFGSGGLPYGSFNATGAFIYGNDDSLPLKNAMDAAAASWGAGRPAYVFIPAGNYLIDATATPLMMSGLGIVGEGHFKTNLILGANYQGDLFAWDEAWQLVGGNGLGGTMSQVSNNYMGPKAIGFSIWGNRTAAAQQNALVFYDRADQVEIDDVDINYINGRCLHSGVRKIPGYPSAMRESRIGRLRCFSAGNPGIPAIEFASIGGGDATNEINIDDINIYAPHGIGFLIRNDTTTSGLRAIRIGKLRIEGLQWANLPAGTDLLRIGDLVWAGTVRDVYINQLELVSPYANSAALRVTTPSLDANPYFIEVKGGSIGGGLPMGYGVVLDGGRNMKFEFSNIYTWNINFTMGSAAYTTSLDGGGMEQSWTYSLAVPQRLNTPFRRLSATSPAGGMVTSCAGLAGGTLWSDAGTVKVCP